MSNAVELPRRAPSLVLCEGMLLFSTDAKRKILHSSPMAKRQRIEVARVGEYWMRVDADTVTQERVLPANLPLVDLHPEFVKKIGPCLVWSIDEPSADERRCALETGVMIMIEITEPTAAELFPESNPMAAEYASKHALEKWFPDILEPTRTKIRQIIKNSFEQKTAFSEVVSDIRAAGIFSVEHSRLMPTDLRKPECPYCKNALKKIPGAKTKCSSCGQFMYVRTQPEDRARVLVTETEAHRIEEGWKTKIMGGAHEPDDVAAMVARTEISQAQVGANWEAMKNSGVVKKIKWLSVGPSPCPICKRNDGVVRMLGEKFPSGDVIPLAHVGCYCILSAVFDSED